MNKDEILMKSRAEKRDERLEQIEEKRMKMHLDVLLESMLF
ncbi:MAG: DUF6442 family protein [Turicibacter sp.]|nr:DUF6442 family protein [Turicibacter sp.]